MSESETSIVLAMQDLASQPIWFARMRLAIVAAKMEPRFRALPEAQRGPIVMLVLFLAIVEMALERPPVIEEPARRYGTQEARVVHVLNRGRSRCSLSSPPSTWPEGHVWVRDGQVELASCTMCIWRSRAEAIAKVLREHVFHFKSEAELQRGIAKVLTDARIPFAAEVKLAADSRVDFMVGAGPVKVAIESKCAGSISLLVRQIHRYIERPEVGSVVVVVSKGRLANLPMTLSGKAVSIVNLLSSNF